MKVVVIDGNEVVLVVVDGEESEFVEAEEKKGVRLRP